MAQFTARATASCLLPFSIAALCNIALWLWTDHAVFSAGRREDAVRFLLEGPCIDRGSEKGSLTIRCVDAILAIDWTLSLFAQADGQERATGTLFEPEAIRI